MRHWQLLGKVTEVHFLESITHSIFVFCSISDGDYEWINITEYEVVNITSPNYPLNYPNSIRCKWRITPCHNCSLSFQILAFDVERYDTLLLKKGLQTWQTDFLGKGDLYISYDDDIWLVFESDYSVSFTGFVLQIAHAEGKKIYVKSISLTMTMSICIKTSFGCTNCKKVHYATLWSL